MIGIIFLYSENRDGMVSCIWEEYRKIRFIGVNKIFILGSCIGSMDKDCLFLFDRVLFIKLVID